MGWGAPTPFVGDWLCSGRRPAAVPWRPADRARVVHRGPELGSSRRAPRPFFAPRSSWKVLDGAPTGHLSTEAAPPGLAWYGRDWRQIHRPTVHRRPAFLSSGVT